MPQESAHISDRLCKTAQLIQKPKFSINNSQSDLSDYTSSISSSVKLSDQMANLSYGHHAQPKIHSIEKGLIDKILFTRNQ